MKLYCKLLRGEELIGIERTTDHAVIPINPDNRDYKAYLKWVAEGNVPDERQI